MCTAFYKKYKKIKGQGCRGVKNIFSYFQSLYEALKILVVLKDRLVKFFLHQDVFFRLRPPPPPPAPPHIPVRSVNTLSDQK